MRTPDEIANDLLALMADDHIREHDFPKYLAVIRAAQIDAAEWMREEALKGALDWVLKNTNPAKNGPSTQGLENAIRSIKLPEDGA